MLGGNREASMEAPREKGRGQSIQMQTEPVVPAWLQNLCGMAEHRWLVLG